MIQVVHPGSWIRMLTFSHPGSKRHPISDPDPQHCSCSHLQNLEAVLEEIGLQFGAEYCNKTHRLDTDPKLDSTKTGSEYGFSRHFSKILLLPTSNP
jgi:hypothetical protein